MAPVREADAAAANLLLLTELIRELALQGVVPPGRLETVVGNALDEARQAGINGAAELLRAVFDGEDAR